MVGFFSLKRKLEENIAAKKKRTRSSDEDIKQKSTGRRTRRKVIVEVEAAMENKDVHVGVDYMSLLPEHVLHQILSYLKPKDAARASVLSKRWRQARYTSHLVEFDQGCFEGQYIHLFQKYVDRFFQRRHEYNYVIQKFKLAVMSPQYVSPSDIEVWLDIAVENNVKEIDLHVQSRMRHAPFGLPLFVLAAQTLTSITLHWWNLKVPNGINLPNLKKLILKRMSLTNASLLKLTSSCPSIEWLALISIKGLLSLEISNLEQLNRLEVHFCKGIRKVEIMAPELESFWFYRYKDPRRSSIKLVDCSSLKRFTLEDPFMDDLTFDKLIFELPCLEHLVLSNCNALNSIRIDLPWLKSLVFRKCTNLKDGEFLVPQLVSFEYSGFCNMLFSLINSSSLRKTKLQFGSLPLEFDAVYFVPFCKKVLEFLSGFDQFSGLKLVAWHKKKIAVYQHWKQFNLTMMLPDMTFEIIKPSMKLEKLLDHLIQTQPKTLSVVADAEWQKILSEKVINQVDQKDALNCCTYYKKKCWRHYLKDAKNVHSTSADISDELGIWISLIEAEEQPSTTLNLSWENESAAPASGYQMQTDSIH